MRSKECSRCKTLKPFSDFNKSKTGKYGLHSYCRSCDAENKKVWYQQNKSRAIRKSQDWKIDNPDRYARNQRNHKDRYREHYSEYYRQWAADNRDKCILNKHRYYSKLRQQLGEVSENIIDFLFEKQNGQCFYCQSKLDDFHLEHMTPISRGGLHDDSNLCLSCSSCNLKKTTKQQKNSFDNN